jgi:hypothetical protein
MDERLQEIIMGMARAIENAPKDDAFRFRNEEDALYHASRFAQLKPGSYVQFRSNEGLHNAVFVQFDDKCRAKILWYDPKDGGYFTSSIIASCLIFDNMPTERADAPQPAEAPACENCEDDEWDGAGPADEFPRT